MTIKQIMNIGCEGLTVAQKEDEQSRRIKVVERFNKLGALLPTVEEKGKKRRIIKEMNSIKATESLWMREVAWFLY